MDVWSIHGLGVETVPETGNCGNWGLISVSALFRSIQQNLSSPVARSTPQKVGGLSPSKSERIIFLKFEYSVEHYCVTKEALKKPSESPQEALRKTSGSSGSSQEALRKPSGSPQEALRYEKE